MSLSAPISTAVFLGPPAESRRCAERSLVRLALRRGGSVPVRSLRDVYTSKPWIAKAVGHLKTFCADSAVLHYSPRDSSNCAALLSVVPPDTQILVKTQPVLHARARLEWPVHGQATRSRFRRHDGRRYAQHMEAHLKSFARLFGCGEVPVQTTACRSGHQNLNRAAGGLLHGDDAPQVVEPDRGLSGGAGSVTPSPPATAPVAEDVADMSPMPLDGLVSPRSPSYPGDPTQLENSAALHTDAQRRGIFPNPHNVTCYLGSVLQGLLHLTPLRAALTRHRLCRTCGEHCVLCLLQHMQVATASAGAECSVYFWEGFFESKGININEQQDALEALQVMCQDHHMEALLKEVATVSTTVRYNVSWPCEHSVPKQLDVRKDACVIELLPGSDDATLSQRLAADANTKVQEWEPCVCKAEPHCTATAQIVATQSVLIFSLSRQAAILDTSGERPRLVSVTKNRTAVRADVLLEICGQRYALRVVLEHVGENCHRGHYVAHIRREDGTYLTYNDHLVSMSGHLPEDTWSNARAFFYEVQEPGMADSGPAHSGAPHPGKPAAARPGDCNDSRDAVHSSRPLIPFGSGQDVVEKDARQLLLLSETGGDCATFLLSLPAFLQEGDADVTLESCNRHLELNIHASPPLTGG